MTEQQIISAAIVAALRECAACVRDYVNSNRGEALRLDVILGQVAEKLSARANEIEGAS